MTFVNRAMLAVVLTMAAAPLWGQTNPLWHEQKTKNYLPHMTWPEVRDLLTRTDMVIIPVAALEEHGPQTPIGTDFFSGVERALLVAQRTDVLVAPILLPGNSPYHMGFPGTITLSAETIEKVYFEAVQSLLRHGFRRFLIYNSHGGNEATSRFIVDRINQETAGVAVELGDAAAPLLVAPPDQGRSGPFDRHAGVGETSNALYLFPTLVALDEAVAAPLTLPPHLEKMLPLVEAGDPTATRVFLAEALKAQETGKHTSTREMTATGVWSVRDPKRASAEQGRLNTDAFVTAAVTFIERWKELRPTRR
jgi:creatinine amidohydrolase